MFFHELIHAVTKTSGGTAKCQLRFYFFLSSCFSIFFNLLFIYFVVRVANEGQQSVEQSTNQLRQEPFLPRLHNIWHQNCLHSPAYKQLRSFVYWIVWRFKDNFFWCLKFLPKRQKNPPKQRFMRGSVLKIKSKYWKYLFFLKKRINYIHFIDIIWTATQNKIIVRLYSTTVKYSQDSRNPSEGCL